jgi:hypothetical protein
MQHLPLMNRRLQYSLLLSGAVAGIAMVTLYILAGLVVLVAGLPVGNPYAFFMPQWHIVPGMMPRGSLDTAVWLLLLSCFGGLSVGLMAFVTVYFGQAPLD